MPTIVTERQLPPAFDGIYDVPEVARYLKAATHGGKVYPVDSPKLIRWIRRGLASPDLIDIPGAELLITFEDLVSMRVIAALRAAGVSWPAIRRGEQWLRKETGAQRPFATEIIWAGQGQVFSDWTDLLLSASRNGQTAFEMLRQYLIPIHGLKFSDSSQVATSWEPTADVLLEPQVQFGAPCVKGTRIPTRTIAGMIEAGDTVEWVAGAFQLTQSEVQAARDWEYRLRSN